MMLVMLCAIRLLRQHMQQARFPSALNTPTHYVLLARAAVPTESMHMTTSLEPMQCQIKDCNKGQRGAVTELTEGQYALY